MEKQRLYGLNNESKIIEYLNNRKISELNEKWKEHIKKMFPDITETDVIYAKHYPDNCSKPDLIVGVNGEEKFISVKTGKCPSVHQESYFAFRRFLERLHVSYRTLEIIRFFHFGDSKKLGTGDHPLTGDELRERFSPYFLEASKELDNERIIKAVVNRAVIRGTGSTRRTIDFLYYGDLENGKLLSKQEIYEIVLGNREHGKTAIHFGGLIYMPSSRKVGRRERNYVRIKWSILSFLYYCDEEDVENMKDGTFKRLVDK